MAFQSLCPLAAVPGLSGGVPLPRSSRPRYTSGIRKLAAAPRMPLIIRTIRPGDNSAVETVIRSCLKEFGADHEGTAWADPDLGRFSEVYAAEGSRYWVAEMDGQIVGGVGIGPLPGAPGICELQKMYCLPAARGRGIAARLLAQAIAFARRHYRQCYLETLPNMTAAQKFYAKNGFVRTDKAPVQTAHFLCDVRFIRDL